MRINFETKFFQKKRLGARIISRYFYNAIKDFQIASRNREPEVIFKFSYDALIKTGITLIAAYGYRVRSRKGHHVKILEKLSQIINNEDVRILGDIMRKKRNLDLYEGGIIISQKEARDYLNFVRAIVKETEKYLKSQKSLF